MVVVEPSREEDRSWKMMTNLDSGWVFHLQLYSSLSHGRLILLTDSA
jgi:hypothetical protein